MTQARFGVSHAEATPLGRSAWHAPNPAAGYDAYVTEEGVSIALNNKTYVSLSLRSLGYGHALRSVGPGAVNGDRQTISITREDGVQEWYVNGPDGLEHGFTLSEPPGAQSQGAPLRLALQLSKGWRAVAGEDGQRVVLRGDGQAVEYGKLVVRDSQGRNIQARLTVADEQVVIEAEDHEATYPLTIDPIFSLQQKLWAADGGPNDIFGYAVALDGDTAAVGVYGDTIGENGGQGSVYVFTRSGSTWTQQQKLISDDGYYSDWFGYSVALDGETLVVGAYGDTIGANFKQGSAYVFTRSGSTWTQQQKLIDPNGAMSDHFGWSVAVEGDTLLVGAMYDYTGGGKGSVYVFTRNGSTWTQQQELIANDGEPGEHFGYSVAISGDTLLVGAPNDKIGANTDQGSAYVFRSNGATWTQQQKLFANDGGMTDFFGSSVALDGDTLLVGAHGDGPYNGARRGSAYVFTRISSRWAQQQKLIANDGEVFDQFGWSVALDGDTLLVGARDDNIGANSDQGSAYVFNRSGSTWTQQQKLIANDGEADDSFGIAVALDGDTLLVGAPFDQIGANIYQGSVYVFNHPTCPTLTFAPASLPSGASGTSYQQQITVSGGVGPYQFSLSSGALPPGLTLTTNGALSGVLPAPGTYNFTITATDLSSYCSSSRAYTITVTGPCSPIAISPSSLPYGFTFEPYSETLTAIGGVGPYTFSMQGMPPIMGLSLSADGVLSGTPQKAATVYFTVQARDVYGCVGSRKYNITIYPMDFETGAATPANGGSRRVVRSQPTVRLQR